MNFEYKEYPPLPEWLVKHLLVLLEQHKVKPTKYDDEFKNRMLREAEAWLNGADEEVLDAIAVLDFDESDSIGYQFTDPKAYAYSETLAKFGFITVDDVVNDWVAENIPEKVIGVNLQAMYGGTLITPHIDELRHYALNYTIETGGTNVSTNFYVPAANFKDYKVYARTCIPFERIELTESHIISTNRWHKINVESIHSVTNIDINKERIALSCSIVR